MRRILVLVTTGVVLLVAAASAYAALNTYTAKLAFTSKKAGTAKKPVATGYTEDLKASSTASGNRTAVLLDIKTSIYGMKANTKGLPVCTATQIAAAKNDTMCPKGAKLATGYITATVGSVKDFTAAGAPCDPGLDVWNSGGGKLTFFFVEQAAHNCNALGLKTGSTGPYPGTEKQVGKNLVVDVPIPAFVSFPLPGLAGSLETEHLVWAKSSKTTAGKTQAVLSSVGCQGSSRPYSVAFTATLPTAGPAKETKSVSAKAPC
ncbi:MAG: hypothetical protein ACR2NR_10440 [Solirubrobacteraceae bacterium]